jgi:HTH-type transcriptional regulator, competence development regulator
VSAKKKASNLTAEQEFGRFLRVKRAELGITLEDLAETADISVTYLSKIERGEMRPPPDERLLDLARALAVDADEMFWRARRLPPELRTLLAEYPRVYLELLRLTHGVSLEDLDEMLGRLRSWRRKLDKEGRTEMAYAV